jgi:8-oxo-dGTP diphosphatase
MATLRSVAGVAFNQGKVLIAKRIDGGAIGLRWEFPGGKVEEGETDENALKREFLEEFGIEVIPVRLLGTDHFHHNGQRRELAAWEIRIDPLARFELTVHSEILWIEPFRLSDIDLADSDRSLASLIQKS